MRAVQEEQNRRKKPGSDAAWAKDPDQFRMMKYEMLEEAEEGLSDEQLEEHYLEIENRIRNLFWTVSGDYAMPVRPDVELFARSKYAAFYEAVKQGAFASQFDMNELSLYLARKIHLGADRDALLELGQLCADAAAYPKVKDRRPGIEELRRKAFSDLLALEQRQKGKAETLFRAVKTAVMQRFLYQTLEGSWLAIQQSDPDKTDTVQKIWIEKTGDIQTDRMKYACSRRKKDVSVKHRNTDDSIWGEEVQQILSELDELSSAQCTDDIIAVIEMVYNRYYDTSFEEKHGGLEQIRQVSIPEIAKWAWQECMTDQQMEQILQEYLVKIGKDLMGLELDGTSVKRPIQRTAKILPKEEDDFDVNAAKKVEEYVALNYGRTYLSPLEQEQMTAKVCRGIHRGCRLHWTDGILHDPVLKNNQYRFAQLQFEKNRLYYGNNHWIIKRNIADLADILKKSLALRKQDETKRARTGQLVPSRLWKLGRTHDKNLFDKKAEPEHAEFVVDILLDASGSQSKRQPQMAVQGYIISEALSLAGIPHRVLAYCTFWNHTVIQRFRDYDDPKEKNLNIFEFRSSGNNRDGLAVKAVGEVLSARPEDRKIMIILSDGRPNDVGMNRPGVRTIQTYTGETAVKDTAFEVRRLRGADFSVFGIFAGDEEDLPIEKKIFGKDFAYIRNIGNFSRMVGTYLKEQFESE